MDTAILEKLMDDAQFVEKLEAVETSEEATKLFSEHGVTLDIADITAQIEQDDKELSEEDLEDVAGGKLGWGALFGAAKYGIALGIVIRTVIDDKRGKGRVYSNKAINKSMDYINKFNPFR